MATKHIPETTWKKVQDLTVKTVIETRTAVKDTEILNALILKGIEATKEDDLANLIKKKN